VSLYPSLSATFHFGAQAKSDAEAELLRPRALSDLPDLHRPFKTEGDQASISIRGAASSRLEPTAKTARFMAERTLGQTSDTMGAQNGELL
jgi:hypothetical protein